MYNYFKDKYGKKLVSLDFRLKKKKIDETRIFYKN